MFVCLNLSKYILFHVYEYKFILFHVYMYKFRRTFLKITILWKWSSFNKYYDYS